MAYGRQNGTYNPSSWEAERVRKAGYKTLGKAMRQREREAGSRGSDKPSTPYGGEMWDTTHTETAVRGPRKDFP